MAEKRILIVDSDFPASERLASTCRNFNFRVAILSEGEGLLEGLVENTPDLVVLAVDLPDANGFVLYKKIRAQSKLKALPVILTAPDAQYEAVEKHRKLKDAADGYLLKPADPDDFIDQVEHLIGLPKPPSIKKPLDHLGDIEDMKNLLDARQSEFEQVIAAKDQEIKILRESYENVSSKLEKSQKDMLAFQEKIASAEQRVEEIQREAESQMAAMQQAVEDQQQGQDHEKVTMREKIAEQESHIEQLFGEREEMQRQLEISQRRAGLSDQENQQRESGLKERIKDLLSQVDDGMRAQNDLVKKMEALSQDRDASLVKTREELDSVQDEKVKMEQRVVKAYKKLKTDQLRDEKIQKALEIALTLLKG